MTTYTVTSHVQLFISEGNCCCCCCCWASFSFFSETFSGLGADSQTRTSCDHTVFRSDFIEDGGAAGAAIREITQVCSHILTLLTGRAGERQRPNKNILEATFSPWVVSLSWDTTGKMHRLHIYSPVSPNRHLSPTLTDLIRTFSFNVTLRTGNLTFWPSPSWFVEPEVSQRGARVPLASGNQSRICFTHINISKMCVISRPLEVKEKQTFCILEQFILVRMLQVKTGCWSKTQSAPCWCSCSLSWPINLLIYLENWNGQLSPTRWHHCCRDIVSTLANCPVRVRSTNPDLSAERRQSKTSGRVNKRAGF